MFYKLLQRENTGKTRSTLPPKSMRAFKSLHRCIYKIFTLCSNEIAHGNSSFIFVVLFKLYKWLNDASFFTFCFSTVFPPTCERKKSNNPLRFKQKCIEFCCPSLGIWSCKVETYMRTYTDTRSICRHTNNGDFENKGGHTHAHKKRASNKGNQRVA